MFSSCRDGQTEMGRQSVRSSERAAAVRRFREETRSDASDCDIRAFTPRRISSNSKRMIGNDLLSGERVKYKLSSNLTQT